MFTNRGRSTCALRGYPGVALVAPHTGRQVGLPASPDPNLGSPVTKVLIAAASSASALLGIANYQNHPQDNV